MKRISMFLGNVILLFVVFVSLVSIAKAADTMPAGQKLFMDKKCNTCHAIESFKIPKKLATSKAPDLSDVGSERSAEWITKWLKKEVDLNGKKHAAVFKGTPEDQKNLADWLATLKKASK